MADLTNTGAAPPSTSQQIARDLETRGHGDGHGGDGHGNNAHASAHHGARAHQFDTAEQQFATSIFGMWVFLATEVLTFGGFFLAYIVYRTIYPDVFVEASTHQDVVAGATNTAVLIFSSLTMALAVWASQTGRRSLLFTCLLTTIGCAVTFLLIKSVEYTDHWNEHLFPGPGFHMEGAEAAMQGPAQLFFVLYWSMTGLHAFHIIIGIFLLGFLAIQTYRRVFSPDYFTPVEVVGLYWHFVDLVWIFLFPLLYLIGGFDFGNLFGGGGEGGGH